MCSQSSRDVSSAEVLYAAAWLVGVATGSRTGSGSAWDEVWTLGLDPSGGVSGWGAVLDFVASEISAVSAGMTAAGGGGGVPAGGGGGGSAQRNCACSARLLMNLTRSTVLLSSNFSVPS